MNGKKKLGIYIHIPYCVRKCLYCDFLSFPVGSDGACKEGRVDNYIKSLTSQIRMEAEKLADEFTVNTIFIGGGTPSCIEAEYIGEILKVIKEKFVFEPVKASDGVEDVQMGTYKLESCDASSVSSDKLEPEISIEVNPGTVSMDKLVQYRKYGINRISIGAQSFCDEELAKLGRIHKAEDVIETFKLARMAGFTNINIDLMTGIPGQDAMSLKTNLEKAIELGPEHISAYSLIVEEGTPYEKLYPDGAVDEDTDRNLYELTGRVLAENGYNRYEISNYAKTGYECRHNLSYWKRADYIGFGLGAASLINDTRFSVTRNPDEYAWAGAGKTVSDEINLAGIYRDMEKLSVDDCMAEEMFLGLRLIDGVNVIRKNQYGIIPMEFYKDVIDKHVREGLLVLEGEYLKLTSKGLDVANYVMSDFV